MALKSYRYRSIHHVKSDNGGMSSESRSQSRARSHRVHWRLYTYCTYSSTYMSRGTYVLHVYSRTRTILSSTLSSRYFCIFFMFTCSSTGTRVRTTGVHLYYSSHVTRDAQHKTQRSIQANDRTIERVENVFKCPRTWSNLHPSQQAVTTHKFLSDGRTCTYTYTRVYRYYLMVPVHVHHDNVNPRDYCTELLP